MKFERLVIRLFILLFHLQINAAEIPTALDYKALTGSDIEYLLDEEGKFDLYNLPHSKFQKYPNNSPNFGLYQGVVWLKINLQTQIEREIILEIKNPMLDYAEIYQKKDTVYNLIEKFGDRYNFSKRSIEHRFFQTHLSIPNEIIIRAESMGDFLVIPINIATEEGITKRDQFGEFSWGLFFGLVIVFLSIGLKFLIFNRMTSIVYFIGYIICISIVQLCYSGLGFQYFLPNSPELLNRLLPFSGGLSIFFSLGFTRLFLKGILNKKHQFIIKILQSLCLLFAALQFIPGQQSYALGILLTNGLVLLSSVYILFCVKHAYNRKYKPATYFFIALILLITGAIIFILRNLALLPDNFFTEYSQQFSTAAFAGFLILAIVQSYKEDKVEAIQNLKKMNALRESEGDQMATEITKQTQEIESKKEEISQKNNLLFESINSAKQIQAHILQSKESFTSNFDSSFLNFYPKDLLSGDFYWQAPLPNKQNKDSFAFCIGDCTGHGVPGSMISILAIGFLSNAILEEKIDSASGLLNHVNKAFNSSFLSSEVDSNINDGMDCAVCTFNKTNQVLTFSGASNDVYIIRNKTLKRYTGDRKSIGGVNIGVHTFNEISIQLQKDDCVYIYTDGFADQFGGPKGKKLKRFNVRNLILEHHTKPMQKQGELISDFFEKWKGSTEQTDDVTIFGFKVE